MQLSKPHAEKMGLSLDKISSLPLAWEVQQGEKARPGLRWLVKVGTWIEGSSKYKQLLYTAYGHYTQLSFTMHTVAS